MTVLIFFFTDESERVMDHIIFESDSYQRVYQYLNYNGENLDHFTSQGVVGSARECLETLIRSLSYVFVSID